MLRTLRLRQKNVFLIKNKKKRKNLTETQTQPKITPKTTKNFGSLMQYFPSKQLPVQIP